MWLFRYARTIMAGTLWVLTALSVVSPLRVQAYLMLVDSYIDYALCRFQKPLT